MNLDYMRSNRPGRPELRTEEVRLPDPGYQDPIPDGGGSLDSYYSEQVRPENSAGVAGTAPGEAPDPTNPGQGVGGQSVNLGSQNINFRARVLSLAGRAGSRVDLALSYNSKVWNLDPARGRIFFNADKGNPAPGWRIGFGIIQGVRTTYAYPASGVKLPIDVTDYYEDETNIYRHTRTDYEQGVEYTNRHIFGLPADVRIYEGEGTATIAARTVFSYDEPAYFDATPYEVTGHDSAGYGPGLITGRGNPTTITQYDVKGSGSRALRHTKYDITGAVSAVYDGAGHMTEFYYEDNFTNKPIAGETRGVATRVRDGDGYWTGEKYDWYTGNARETYHLPGTGGSGAPENVTTYVYASDDRLKEVRQPTGGLYERVYWDNWIALAEYTRIDPGASRYEFSAWEGTGQLRWEGGDHPDGVSGKFSIQKYTHDTAGRTTAISNTTAVDGNQVPIDDDAAGYQFTLLSYDELDRQTRITRPDLSSVGLDYTGCSCAGKSTVTITDERGKKRRLVRDFLERLQQAHDLDSASNTYSKAVYSYDVRDLMTKIEHYDSATKHQDRTLEYDGYGRIVKETTPEVGTLDFGYYGNDLVESIVHNERGTSVIYHYNNRNLVTDIDYNDSTPDVHYEYGEYGERTAMQEKDTGGAVVSTTNYGYDPYKRLASETRSFWGFAGTYTVVYDYNYVGLTQITVNLLNSYYPSGWTRRVNYAYNFAGSVASIGTDLIGVDAEDKTNVVNSLLYRGFGGLKSLRYGANPRRLQAGYDVKRQQMTSLLVDLPDGTDAIINRAYDYLNGGPNNSRIQRITNGVESDYTTTFDYDEHNRLASATSVAWSRRYSYDPWGNLTRVETTGGTGETYDLSYATNTSGAPAMNQIANPGFSYDAAGNQTNNGWQAMTYDGANRLRSALGGETLNDYDGDGRRAKHVQWSAPIYYLPVVECPRGAGA